MKWCIAAFAFLISCAAAVYPQDTGQALDYGVRVNIDAEYETSLDLSYREDPNTHMMLSTSGRALSFPVWAPGGDRIYYSDHINIFSIPVTGGTPRLEFEGILLYPFNGRRYVLSQYISGLAGVSPDGKNLYFVQQLIGEGSGAQITITEHFDENGEFNGWGAKITGSDPTLQCLDLETGTVTTVAHSVWESTLSHSGKYLEYYTWDTRIARVRDLETGEDWSVPVTGHTVSFTDNDQNLLYATSSGGTGAFFKVPVRGGEPQQVTALSAITEKPAIPPSLDCIPEGDWMIYGVDTGETYKETFNGGSFTKSVQKLYLANLITGRTMEVVPFSKTIDAYWPRFSPDGKKICYIHNDWVNNPYVLYIKDISSFLNSDTQVSVADAAPSGFALTGNYPNPFNPSTHISFTLPSSGTAKLSIYDATGRTVRDLVSPALPAGAHEMVWDGRDDSGKAVSSGTYIARLKMGNFTASHRMTLMK